MSALLTDLYQLTMMQAYLDEGLDGTAVFELFVRKLPPQRNFLVAAGLEQAVQFLKSLSFSEAEHAWLCEQPGVSRRLIDYTRTLRFHGDVDAMPEGTVFFADEPVLRVTAPLPLAQLVESRLLNIVHFETLIASKAARAVIAAQGRQLIDFGMRRAHGSEAALLAARAAYLAGFDGTATADAGRRFDVPVFGTMAHSYIQAHRSEQEAFAAFLRSHPEGTTILLDTYDTEAAADKLIGLLVSHEMRGIQLRAVRLDSGDLGAHARAVRQRLDAAGLHHVKIFASGNLDEQRVAALLRDGAPIDGFGIGTSLDTSSDAPSLDAVYKLQHYAGTARRKRSEGKATWPGIKQVYRQLEGGHIARDIVALHDEQVDGTPLLAPRLRDGRRAGPSPTLAESRAYHAQQLAMLPPQLRSLDAADTPFAATISPAIVALARKVDTLEI